MSITTENTPIQPVMRRHFLAWLRQPQPLWGVVAAGALALLVAVALTPVLQAAWQALVSFALPSPMLATPVDGRASLGFSLTLLVMCAGGWAFMANGPAQRVRMARIAGGLTAASVAVAMLGRAYSAADASPFFVIAALWGGAAGRVAYELFSQWADRRMAEQLRVTRLAIQQARADFLQQLARELRTPVHTTVGVADLLAETALDLAQRRHMAVFKRSADAMTRLVDDLGDLARMESQRVSLRREPFALVSFLHEHVSAARKEAEAKGLQLQLSLASDTPHTVYGDSRRLGQVLSQVLAQAVRGTRQGRISIEVRPHQRQAELIRFTVTDTGLSPVTGTLASLMEPFETDMSGAKQRPSAIGAAVSERLVEMMGGKLSVRQTEGKGSSVMFSVLLAAEQFVAPIDTLAAPGTPVMSAATGFEPTVQDAAPGGANTAVGAWRPALMAAVRPSAPALVSILLVDDNFTTRELIGSMLDKQRFSVVTCSSGNEALDALKLTPFDVVLMDLTMPELDGWATVRILRRHEMEHRLRRTPVIALGSAPFEAERQRSLDAGFDDHLCKPLRKSRLIEAIALAAAMPAKAKPTPTPEPGAMRFDQRDALNLLSQDGMVDVRASIENLGGDATVYLDAIEHLAPALSNWPSRFRDALNRHDFQRARQMALDMQGILEIVGAGPCAAALGRMAAALSTQKSLPAHAAALGDLDGYLLPLLSALQQAAERIRHGRAELPRKEQGHNSAF